MVSSHNCLYTSLLLVRNISGRNNGNIRELGHNYQLFIDKTNDFQKSFIMIIIFLKLCLVLPNHVAHGLVSQLLYHYIHIYIHIYIYIYNSFCVVQVWFDTYK